jgi:hypothetical protein
MKKYVLFFILIISCEISYGQTRNEELIFLAEAFHQYHSTPEVDPEIFKRIDQIKSSQLQEAKEFIAEIIKPKNKILDQRFLTKPSAENLKILFTIIYVNYNMFAEKPIDNNLVIKKIDEDKIDENEMLAKYYSTIFGSLVNKNRDIDLSQTNFDLENLNLKSAQEKGIFFLTSMERFGSDIWGYMNIANPPNYKKALLFIKRYPKYNNNPYYAYNDFKFEDFNLTIDIRNPKSSFKDYYLKKYFQVLSYHILTLENKD